MADSRPPGPPGPPPPGAPLPPGPPPPGFHPGPPPGLHPPPPGDVRVLAGDERGLGDLIGELGRETGLLVQQEVALAKAEIKQEVRTAGKSAASIAAGGAVAYSGLIALVIGLGWGLGMLFDEDLDMVWLGITLMGLLVAGIGYFLLKKGLDTLQDVDPVPERTIRTLKEDKEMLKQEAHDLTP